MQQERSIGAVDGMHLFFFLPEDLHVSRSGMPESSTRWEKSQWDGKRGWKERRAGLCPVSGLCGKTTQLKLCRSHFQPWELAHAIAWWGAAMASPPQSATLSTTPKDFPQFLVQILADPHPSPPARRLGFFPIFFFFVLVLQINVYHSLKQLLDAAARE